MRGAIRIIAPPPRGRSHLVLLPLGSPMRLAIKPCGPWNQHGPGHALQALALPSDATLRFASAGVAVRAAAWRAPLPAAAGRRHRREPGGGRMPTRSLPWWGSSPFARGHPKRALAICIAICRRCDMADGRLWGVEERLYMGRRVGSGVRLGTSPRVVDCCARREFRVACTRRNS